MLVQQDTIYEEPGTALEPVPAVEDATASRDYDREQLRSGLWWEGARPGGVLLLHDLGRTPEGLADLAMSLYYEGFWTAAPLLPGHETIESTGRLRTPTLADTLAAVDRWAAALQAATTPLVVVGCGLGASLAVLVANTYPVHGLVTVNLPVRSYRGRRFRARVSSMAIGRALGLVDDTKDADATELAARFLTHDSFKLACELERLAAADLGSVGVPTLMFQSREDHVTDPRDAADAFERLGTQARELVWLERSFHQAWIDHDAHVVSDRVGAFVRALADRPALPAAPEPEPVHQTGEFPTYVTGEMPVHPQVADWGWGTAQGW